MVPKIQPGTNLPAHVHPDSLLAIDWVYRGLISHRGTWTFPSNPGASPPDAEITAVNYDTDQIHIRLYQNGKLWYEICPMFHSFMTNFTFNSAGDDCRLYQLGLIPNLMPSPGVPTTPHACADNRKTYDSGWSRYDYCGVCDKKIT